MSDPGTPAPDRTLRLILEYDGSRFVGWQAQRDLPSVEAELRAASPVHKRLGHRKDVDKDGLLDLVSHYRIPETGIAAGDPQACLRGEIDGAAFEGCDAVTAR